VIKIKALWILLGLFLVLMVPMALGVVGKNVGKESTLVGGHLIITDVDVKVGGKSDKNLRDKDDISDEAAPGDKVEFSIEIANNFTRDDDIEIEDITITVTIEGIDDGDDLEEESNEFDLKEDKDEKKRIVFEIPLEVDEDTYDVLIEVEGDTRSNGTQFVEMELTLEVQKEDNEVRFLRNDLSPSEVKCSRTVQLSVGVINTGNDNEDDATLEITNSNLGVNFRETFDLSDDPFDDDSKFRKTFTFPVANDVTPGIYQVISRVIYNDGRDTETNSADLVVGTCEAVKPPVVEEEKPKEQEEPTVVVVQPPVTPPTGPTGGVTAEPVSPPTLPTTEESFFESTGFLVALVAGEVLLVIIAILIVVAVARKRRE
jgi:hypothetical protein